MKIYIKSNRNYVKAYWNTLPNYNNHSTLFEFYKTALMNTRYADDVSDMLNQIANDRTISNEEFNELYGLAVELGI